MNKITVIIKIWGIVQGVGFRPFIAKLADRMNMYGEVLNIGGLVHITVTDSEDRIYRFVDEIKKNKPIPAEIVHLKIEKLDYLEFKEFTIADSMDGGEDIAMIPADLAICNSCIEELFNEENPRYLHPFISCMACGPRYTIIDKIPYDRENTSMIDFPMCDFCSKEYTDREDRRYHAQTVSCHDCGPYIKVKLKNHSMWDNDPINSMAMIVESKGVIGVKGVGGYNLICDSTDKEAVIALRKIKGREEKPFAVMFKNIEHIKEHCVISEEEENLLLSSARPIVLLERKMDMSDITICDETYKSSRYIGAFLPSMGLQYLLLNQLKDKPIIVTSANFTDRPIIVDDEEMFSFYENESLISGLFYNERKIRIAVDDSVVRVIDGQPQITRRAKGYAPVPLFVKVPDDNCPQIFATGGQLKSAFSLSKGSFVYVSQYFGDLDSRETCQAYEENFDRMKEIFRIEPEFIAYDMHPLYMTSDFAEDYERKMGLKSVRIQHHHGHIASVMAEHNLSGPVIGVAFDGTGYGDDGNIWGGEFLLCQGADYDRVAHLKYVDMLGGDSSMKEGWKSAMSYIYYAERSKLNSNNSSESIKGLPREVKIDLLEYIEGSKVKERPEWNLVKAALDNKVNIIKSSSMGRLFDGVASLLDIHHVNRYEGECAIMLENAAAMALDNPGVVYKNDMALKFHNTIAEMILRECEITRSEYEKNNIGENCDQVALSGGVFQNKILMELTLKLLRDRGFKVFYNISVPPNDGGVALGQNYIAMIINTRRTL